MNIPAEVDRCISWAIAATVSASADFCDGM